jgi:hypothetical protein
MHRLGEEHEIGGTADFDQAAFQAAHARRVAGGKAKRDLGRHVAQRRQQGHHAQDAERLDTGTGRAIRSEDDALHLAHFARDAQRIERGALIAVMDDLEARLTAFADAADFQIRQGRVAAIDVADDIGARRQNDVGADQARARHRGAAGMDP